MGKHALLSPSSASRWLSCTKSARFEEQFPETTSAFAKEGTLAHSLGELLIREKLGHLAKADFKKQLAAIQADDLYDDTMLDYCDEYATFVMERFAIAQSQTKDAVVFLEMKLNMTDYVPEGFGTGDTVIVADDLMETIDLKYGKGVAVSVEENKQQMLYALGALREFSHLYDIARIRMTVYQPRISNIASWEISVVDLTKWAEEELKPKALLAFEGGGEYAPGNHCQFCKGKPICKALADKNLEIAKYEFKDANILEDTEISDILSRIKMFINWIDAVEDYALNAALNNAKVWPGFKVVEGRSNRKYTDEAAIIQVLESKANFSIEEITRPRKLFPITELEKEIGKEAFSKFVSGFLIKPKGKPALVPITDKRPEYTGVESAVADFSEPITQ
jgi:hypothetical protein